MNDYIVVDIETTGISPEFEEMTEIGGAKVIGGEVVATFNTLINPNKPIPDNIRDLTGISDEMVKDAPPLLEAIRDFVEFSKDLPLLGHNIGFDYSFLKTAAAKHNLKFEKTGLDTLVLARAFMTTERSYSLTSLLSSTRIHRENAHRGLDDAIATHKLYQLIVNRYQTEYNRAFFEPKPLYYKPRKQSPITDKQKKFLLSLLKQHKLELEEDIDDLSKSEASRKIDYILRDYGRKTD